MKRRKFLQSSFAGLLTGCAARNTTRIALPDPQAAAPRALVAEHPRLALVLSGGSRRGFAHIGVLRVLERAGIEPDLVIGTSAGSIVGTLYAAGWSAAAIEAEGANLRLNQFAAVSWPLLGLFDASALEDFVNERIGYRPIESLPRRLCIVATDLRDGTSVSFVRGNAGRAVRASCSIPGILQPTSIAGVPYVDGGLSRPLPVETALEAGARVIVASNVIYDPAKMEPSNPLSVANESLLIMIHRLAKLQSALAHVLIAPQLPPESEITLSNHVTIIESYFKIRYKLRARTFTIALSGSKLTFTGSPPSCTSLICAASMRRCMTMPRSLLTRCSSECNEICPCPYWASKSLG